MSNAQHTPGPWEITDGDATTKYIYDSLGEDGLIYPIATVEHGDIAELSANARLIAAAPELLEALEKVCVQYQLVRDADEGFNGIPSKAITEARAAIAKARGE